VSGFIRGGADNLSVAAISEDGSLLAIGGLDGSVAVWRLPSVTSLGSTVAVRGAVSALAFSSDGELAVGGSEGDVARWRVGDNVPTTFDAHTDAVLALAFRRESGLVTAGRDGLLRAFAPTTGAPQWSMSLPGHAIAGSFDHVGSRYAQLDLEAQLTVVELDTARTRIPVNIPFGEGQLTALTLSANGRMLGLGDRQGGVHLLDIDRGDVAELGRLGGRNLLDESSAAAVEQLAFTASGGLVAAAGGVIENFDRRGRQGASSVQQVGGRVTDLAVDPSGQAAAVTETGETILLQLEGSGVGRLLSNAGAPVLDLSNSGESVTAAGDRQAAVLDLATGSRRMIDLPGRPVTALSMAESLLAAGGAGVVRGGGGPFGSYTLVDVRSGEVLVDDIVSAPVTAIALHPDGELLAVGDAGGNLLILDSTTGRPVAELDQMASAVTRLAFSGATSLSPWTAWAHLPAGTYTASRKERRLRWAREPAV